MFAKPPRVALLLVLAAACWGLGTVVSKHAVAVVPPLTLLAIQLAASIGFLAVAGLALGERLRMRRDEAALARLGLLNPGLSYALGLLGLTTISASLSVLIWAAEPIVIIAVAAVLLRERVRPAFLALSAVALAGLVAVVASPAAPGALAGAAISGLGVLCCAVYTVAARAWIRPTDSTLAVVVAQDAWALALAVALAVVAAGTGGTIGPAELDLLVVASAVGSGLLYYGLAYSFYLAALRELPASVAATSFYLIPVFGLAAATAFGERLEPVQWAGALVVVLAVAGVGALERRASAVRPAASAAA